MANLSKAAHQYTALRDALQKHGCVVIHRTAITALPGLEAVAQDVARAVPGATLTRNLEAGIWELTL